MSEDELNSWLEIIKYDIETVIKQLLKYSNFIN